MWILPYLSEICQAVTKISTMVNTKTLLFGFLSFTWKTQVEFSALNLGLALAVSGIWAGKHSISMGTHSVSLFVSLLFPVSLLLK